MQGNAENACVRRCGNASLVMHFLHCVLFLKCSHWLDPRFSSQRNYFRHTGNAFVNSMWQRRFKYKVLLCVWDFSDAWRIATWQLIFRDHEDFSENIFPSWDFSQAHYDFEFSHLEVGKQEILEYNKTFNFLKS